MDNELAKMEAVRQRTGVSYAGARYALEEAGGDVAEAVVVAERDRQAAGGDLAAAGMDFLDELKRFVSDGDFRRVRIRFGNKVLKEFAVSPRSALAALALAVAAVAVTKLYVEIERASAPEGAEAAPGYETA
ncbi:MAG: hypothetical protein HY321_20545 [Armatimonadetes bacterium]|nr:hypothetical protein [Armatimonadota bacterium]